MRGGSMWKEFALMLRLNASATFRAWLAESHNLVDSRLVEAAFDCQRIPSRVETGTCRTGLFPFFSSLSSCAFYRTEAWFIVHAPHAQSLLFLRPAMVIKFMQIRKWNFMSLRMRSVEYEPGLIGNLAYDKYVSTKHQVRKYVSPTSQQVCALSHMC